MIDHGRAAVGVGAVEDCGAGAGLGEAGGSAVVRDAGSNREAARVSLNDVEPSRRSATEGAAGDGAGISPDRTRDEDTAAVDDVRTGERDRRGSSGVKAKAVRAGTRTAGGDVGIDARAVTICPVSSQRREDAAAVLRQPCRACAGRGKAIGDAANCRSGGRHRAQGWQHDICRGPSDVTDRAKGDIQAARTRSEVDIGSTEAGLAGVQAGEPAGKCNAEHDRSERLAIRECGP